MSVGNPSLVYPPRSASYTVQLAPYLIETICELARGLRDKSNAQTEISGLLFGSIQNACTIVDALKTFKDSGPRSDLARRERLDRAFEAATAQAAEDPELVSLKLVGWFSLRGSSGLLTSDVEFHNRHFKNSDDLALVIWREAETQVIAELYSRAGASNLSSDDYRWSSVRLSTEMRRVSEPIDLAMRVKVSEDSYLRTYQTTEDTKRDDWKRIFSFLPGRRKGSNGHGGGHAVSRHDSYMPTPPARSQESMDSGILFRRSDAPEPTRFVEPARGLGTSRSARQSQPAEVTGLPMVINRSAPPSRRVLPWVSTALVFVLFSGLTFAVLAIRGLATGNGKLSQIMRVIFPGTDLGVRVDSQGEKLLVSWNRRNPAVASATDAVLQIFDGTEHRDVRLDPGQVADGSVLYKPLSNDVTFRLEVHGTDQSTALGSIRVLDATNGMAGARENRSLDLTNTPTPAPVAAPASRPTEPARRPVIYRSGENGRVSVPVPLAAPSKASKEPAAHPAGTTTVASLPDESPAAADPSPLPAAAGSDSTTQTAQNQSKSASAPTPVQAFRASPPPASQKQPASGGTQPVATGSTINGWDASPPEPVRPPSVPAQQREDAEADTKLVSFVAPRPLLQVMPNTKTLAPGTVLKITRVEVEVKVDNTGRVVGARALTDNPQGALANAAVSAARQWTFQPAMLRGEKVQSDHTIVFEFRPEPQ